MSTSMSFFSSIRLKMIRADFESSTTRARLRAVRSLFGGFRGILVLFDPGQRRFDIGQFTGSEPLHPDAGRVGLLAGEFRRCDRMHPNQAAADLGGEFLLLF